jgi:hypothetical protein
MSTHANARTARTAQAAGTAERTAGTAGTAERTAAATGGTRATEPAAGGGAGDRTSRRRAHSPAAVPDRGHGRGSGSGSGGGGSGGGGRFGRRLAAELLEQRSTRTVLGLFVAMVVLVAFAAFLHGFNLPADQLTTVDDQLRVFGWGMLGAVFAANAGAISMTGPIRHGTIRPTFLTTPRRGLVVAAKVCVSMAVGAVFGLVTAAVALGAGMAALAGRDIDSLLGGGDVALLIAGGAVWAALWGAIGVGVGSIVRNQLATGIGIVVWLMFVENLLVAYVPEVGRLTPGAAGAAVAGTETDPGTLLSPAAGAVLLVAYAAVAVAVGWAATARRDVP